MAEAKRRLLFLAKMDTAQPSKESIYHVAAFMLLIKMSLKRNHKKINWHYPVWFCLHPSHTNPPRRAKPCVMERGGPHLH